jgi:GNAT superfamily N-acetyltransferase
MRFAIHTGTPADLATLVAIDDDASRLYAQAGLHIDFPPEHPFAVAERASWRRSLELGRTFMAIDDAGAPLGFAALDLVDGAPYLDQLSVRLASMRRGFGRALLGRAIDWARDHGAALWLNTYDHLPWNRPFYEKEGFVVVPAVEWGPNMTAIVEDQRQVLPAPERRVVMRRPL